MKYDESQQIQYGGRPPYWKSSYWIRCDVIILHPGTLCYVPNTVLNFHLDWFSTFWYTWSFMFHHFGWKLPIQGQIFRVLGLNRGQISIFHFTTLKRHILARFHVFWAVKRQNPSRGLFSTLVREKNKTRSSADADIPARRLGLRSK